MWGLVSKRTKGGRCYLLRISPFAATITVAPVDTDDTAAFQATPPLLLSFNEGDEANSLDTFQVLYHAHCVFRSVSFV